MAGTPRTHYDTAPCPRFRVVMYLSLVDLVSSDGLDGTTPPAAHTLRGVRTVLCLDILRTCPAHAAPLPVYFLPRLHTDDGA